MLLTRLTLEDVGVYGGSNKFDLATTSEKPIVLYGGINGAGKTTLFESILLCLYGHNFSDKRMSKKHYHQKIHNLFHRCPNTRTSAKTASVALEFQYAWGGEMNEYRIVRIWSNDDGRIGESLMAHRRPVSDKTYSSVDLEESQIQSLIDQMMPRAIAGMFFFDGEKIQSLAMSGDEAAYIKSSFDSLLGLDVPTQLYDDLGLYMLRSSGTDSDLTTLEQATKDKENAERKLEHIQEKRVFLRSEIGHKSKDLEQTEAKFFKMGGAFAQNRQKMMLEKEMLDKNIKLLESTLRNLVEETLPFAIVSDQMKQVQDELRSDTTKIKESFEKEMLDSAFSHMIKSISPFLDSYDLKIKQKILQQLHEIAGEKLESLSGRQLLTFDLSLSEMNLMEEKISTILAKQYRIISENHASHKRDLERLKVVTAKLETAPQQDEVGPVYSKIRNLLVEIGEMEQEHATLERLEAQEKSLIVLINSKIRKLLSKTRANQRNARGLEMIPKIQGALEDYSGRLRMKKVRLLESNIFDGVRRCFHKDRLVTRISIDPETYNVTLYGKNDDQIPRNKLSRGELQMYATAIMWGLAKTSGRPLPFIIDTPLARLDKRHRENVIKYFYPEASHQTVIFSTDSEIIGSYHEMLRPYISKEKHITYDPDKDVSLVHDEYFKGGRLVEV